MNNEFHTVKGYQRLHEGAITESMEDYLEMLCRYLQDYPYMRINLLAQMLNVRPSSASKMVGKLRGLGLVQAEKYGIVLLTKEGQEMGEYLLWRHEVLTRFFCRLNGTKDELQQVELVEHFLNKDTLEHLEELTARMEISQWP